MTQQTAATQQPTPPEARPALRGERNGLTTFAGVVLVVAGAFQILIGLVALVTNEFYVNTPNFIFMFDLTRWGWIHLLIGLVVLLAGFAVLGGQSWGRWTGIVVAALSAISNFAFIPYYPFWSLTIIALAVIVIWALATSDRDPAV